MKPNRSDVKNNKRARTAATIAATFSILEPTAGFAALPAVGDICKPVGAQKTALNGNLKQNVVCAKVGKKNIWLAVPNPLAGTPKDPNYVIPTPSTSPAPSSSELPKTFDGDTLIDFYGNSVQVSIIVNAKKITRVDTSKTSMRNKFVLLSIPRLTKETLSVQSAAIQGVSGASYTSAAFVGSLYSALSKAGLPTGLAQPPVVPSAPARPLVSPSPTKTEVQITFGSIGIPQVAADGLTVTLKSIEKVELSGSINLNITYTLQNLTPDKKIDEGTFKLFYVDGSNEPQYGFFGSLFPNDSKDRSYTWTYLKSKTPHIISYGTGFLENSPGSKSLNWRVP